ncbi:hypothetical protein DRQ29_05500 [bacterium]|nr:MAG: hypothetical protein DRQ29_05500 [bacterium]
MPIITTTEKVQYDAIAQNGLVQQNLEDKDYTIVLTTSNNFGASLSRAEIEVTISDNGYPLPTDNVSFYLIDSSRIYTITYLQSIDEFVYEKLTKAS